MSRSTSLAAVETEPAGVHLRPWTLALLVGLAAMAVYLPSFRAELILLDDPQYVSANSYVLYPSWTKLCWTFAEVLHPATVYGYYQPITLASLMLDRVIEARLSGGYLPTPDPFIFHFTNILLHGMNAALVFWFSFYLTRHRLVAAVCGLFFALHPLNVEVVSWVSQRKALLATLFSLLMVLAHVRYAAARRLGWLTAVLAAFVACMLSKPTGLLMPLVLLAIDAWPLKRLGWRAVIEKWPLFVVAAACGYVAYVSQTTAVDLTDEGLHRPLGSTLLIACHNVAFYLAKIVMPIRLCPQYVISVEETITLSSPVFAAGVFSVAVLVGACLWSLKRRVDAVWTMLASFILLIGPTLTPVRFTGTIAADRFAYTPMIAVIMLFAVGLRRVLGASSGQWHDRRVRWLAAIAIAVLALMSLATVRQQAVWKTSFSYYQAVFDRFPDSPNGNYGMGNAWLTERDRYEVRRDEASSRKASECLARALAAYHESIRLDPSFSHAYYRVGHVLILQGRLAKGIEWIKEGLALPTADPEGYFFLGLAYTHAGEYAKAIEPYEICLRRQPSWTEVCKNLANALLRTGRAVDALEHFEHLYELNPTDLDGVQNWGVALLTLGRCDEAAAKLEPVVQLRAQLLENARANAETGPEARTDELKELTDKLADARYTIAGARTLQGDFRRAMEELRAAVDLAPRLLNDARGNPAFRTLRETSAWRRFDEQREGGIGNGDSSE